MNILGIFAGVIPGGIIFATDECIKRRIEKGRIKIPKAVSHREYEEWVKVQKTNAEIQGEEAGGKIKKGLIRTGWLHNTGVAGGNMSRQPFLVKMSSILMEVTALGMLFKKLGVCLRTSEKRNLRQVAWLLALSLLAGGGASNTADRLRRGYVVDYFSFNVGPERFRNLVFNISDMGITLGALWGLLLYLTEKEDS